MEEENMKTEGVNVKFAKLDPRAVMPKDAFKGDMGFDVTAISMEYDEEHDSYCYHTGIAFESPKHYGAYGFPRSKNTNTDCYLANSVGVLDLATYRGEIIFKYKNRTSWEVRKMLMDWEAIKSMMSIKLDAPNEYIGETVRKMREAMTNKKEGISPMDFAPYKVGDRIGQIVFTKVPIVNLVEVTPDELSKTERADGGFGHSGN